MKDDLRLAAEVFKVEAKAVADLAGRLNQDFERAVELLLSCKGRVVVTGMGKAGLVAQKISATLSSTGSPSLSLHPAEAIHGDLGRVTSSDVVIALSNSGETEEVLRLLPILKKLGAPVISMTGNPKSQLARNSDVALDVSVHKEACPLQLAPTSSTTAQMAMGDALAVVLIQRRGFQEKDFALFHPGGALGKRLLLKVEDIMRSGQSMCIVPPGMPVREVLLQITQARSGCA
ncbi:MAG: KpsF/GutQ family sugar-phosphate isomerase, partial [Candidatus Omnitrophica bacterium]|nr:KpsF/GutQ family sugar-phosphate isomerase [Candidatus Omnitrophota bacterium]